MLAQGHVQGSLRHTGTVAHFAYQQIVAHQKALFQRAGGDYIVLEKIYVYEIDSHQSKYNGIYPPHHSPDNGIVGFLPPGPGNEFCNVRIENEGKDNQSPPGIYPVKESYV